MKKEYINEVAWSKILIFLKDTKEIYIGNDKPRLKRFIEAVYWMSRTDAQWCESYALSAIT